MVADSRFNKDIKKEIVRLNKEVLKTCKINNFKIRTLKNFDFIDFKDNEKTTQYRATYWVEKEKHFTYNDFYIAINKIKAVPYKIINNEIIKL